MKGQQRSMFLEQRQGSRRVSSGPTKQRSAINVRRLLLVFAVLIASCAAFGFAAPQALACDGSNTKTTQGLNWRGVHRDIGTRAYLQGSSVINSCGWDVASVAIQNGSASSTTGGIQTGYWTQSIFANTDCYLQTGGLVGEFTEYLPVGGIYHCVWYADSTFGAGDSFKVEHISGGWQTYAGGNAELPNPVTDTQMGFSAGNSFARGEVHWSSPTVNTLNVTWGGAFPAWHFKTNSSGCCTTYTDVDSYANGTSWDGSVFDNEDTDNDWNVGSASADPPSPFNITFSHS